MNILRVLIVLLVIGGLLLIGTWYWRSRPERMVVGALKTGEIVIDDFGFRVLSSTTVDALGTPDQPVLPRGRFVVVTLQVNNHAKRVDYRFEPRIAWLVSGSGDDFPISPEGQAALDARRVSIPIHAEPLRAGESCVTEVVFDVPREARDLMFRVSFLPGILDAFDVALFGEQRIRIE